MATMVLRQIEAGNLIAADAQLRTVLQPDGSCWSMGQRTCWAAWARLELRRGDLQQALEILDRINQPRADGSPTKDVPNLLALRGEALIRLDKPDEAQHTRGAARALAALFGFRPLLWRINATRGDACRASGRHEQAEHAYRAARATIDEIAAAIPDADIREPFRSRAYERAPLGREDADDADTTAQLSPRELDVLRLLVEGKSDREIAEELFISPRTVMRHVTGILTKLDVPSRTAAATVAIRRRIV